MDGTYDQPVMGRVIWHILNYKKRGSVMKDIDGTYLPSAQNLDIISMTFSAAYESRPEVGSSISIIGTKDNVKKTSMRYPAYTTYSPSRKRMDGFAIAAHTTDKRRFSPFDKPFTEIPPARVPPIRLFNLSARPAS